MRSEHAEFAILQRMRFVHLVQLLRTTNPVEHGGHEAAQAEALPRHQAYKHLLEGEILVLQVRELLGSHIEEMRRGWPRPGLLAIVLLIVDVG